MKTDTATCAFLFLVAWALRISLAINYCRGCNWTDLHIHCITLAIKLCFKRFLFEETNRKKKEVLWKCFTFTWKDQLHWAAISILVTFVDSVNLLTFLVNSTLCPNKGNTRTTHRFSGGHGCHFEKKDVYEYLTQFQLQYQIHGNIWSKR